jgi:RNA polymerase sigma-70 factor (ECF subfamily)
MELTDSQVITLLARRDEARFEQVFKTYYKDLHAYAYSILKDEAMSEEMVQNVFFKLWERAEGLHITGSVAAYLYRAVHNESLNYLKHLKVRAEHRLFVVHRQEKEEGAARSLAAKELEARLMKAMSELPEQCRTVFQLSRFEELRYREIADKLDISVKTVENHMGKALKLLREKLVDLMPVIFLLLTLKSFISVI